jgi:hypothetical protein
MEVLEYKSVCVGILIIEGLGQGGSKPFELSKEDL